MAQAHWFTPWKNDPSRRINISFVEANLTLEEKEKIMAFKRCCGTHEEPISSGEINLFIESFLCRYLKDNYPMLTWQRASCIVHEVDSSDNDIIFDVNEKNELNIKKLREFENKIYEGEDDI